MGKAFASAGSVPDLENGEEFFFAGGVYSFNFESVEKRRFPLALSRRLGTKV